MLVEVVEPNSAATPFADKQLERRLADGQVSGAAQAAAREAVAVVRRVSTEVDRLCRTRPWR